MTVKNNISIYKKYDIILERLSLDRLELLRNWRNDPKISQYMGSKEYITPEMHMNWFNKINNDNNYHFIVIYNNEAIGSVNIKDINYEKKCGEPGIFIYEDKYLNSDVGFRMALCNTDFAFDYLKLEYLYGIILADNKRAIRFNNALGYLPDKIQKYSEKISCTLTKERYFEYRNKILNLFPK